MALSSAYAAEPVQSDDQARSINAELFGTAKQYFPGDEQGAAPKRLYRLTRDQIDATVETVLPAMAARSVKTAMDRDPTHTNYEFADGLELNAANLGQYSKWVGEIAQKVGKTPKVIVDCTAEKDAEDCLAAGVRRFVVRAFREEVGDKETDPFVVFYLEGLKTVGPAQAAADLTKVVLQSPYFLFRREFGQARPRQHLNALAYLLADAPAEQLAVAAGEAIAPPQAGRMAATVDAILATKPAREKLVRFFKAWLEIKEPKEFTISEMVFPQFNEQVRNAMLQETDNFLRAKLSAKTPSLADLTQATQSYVPKPLEAVYGVKGADAAGTKPIALDPSQRLGIFSQAAVIASHSGPTDSRPLKRGVFWVRKLMCMELGAQPTDIKAELVEIPGATTRQVIEQSTSTPQCAGCHKVINPFAFMMESYDALGRWRTTENGRPIDASIAINFLDEDASKAPTTVAALKTFTNSMMFKQCFVRQVFRFYMGRMEEPSDDPLLRLMFFELVRQEDQAILPLIRTLAASDRVVRRE